MVTARWACRAATVGRVQTSLTVCSLIATAWFLGSGAAVFAQAPPCATCPPGPHWIHNPNCPPGGVQTTQVQTGATLGIDMDMDCVADTELVIGGQANILVRGALDDSQNFPGLRPMDGHLDVIDTEILSMQLTGGGVQLLAGAGLGMPPGLPPSRGAAGERPSNPTLADSFFDVFVEITLPGGNVLYNWQPIRVEQAITCVTPDANLRQLEPCIPLFDTPPGQPGVPVANLVRTDHFTYPACCRQGICTPNTPVANCQAMGGNPVPSCLGDGNGNGQDDACEQFNPQACCLPLGACTMMPPGDCDMANGIAGGAGSLCEGDANGDGIDDACDIPPCGECGPGPHFIDNPPCPPGGSGADTVPSGAVLGIDTNFDCVADVNVVAFGPVTIGKQGPYDDSNQYPGLRPIDGHNEVIDTEIIAMQLTGGGVIITAGAGLGAQPLSPTLGAIAEQPGNPSLADSFFDVFVEVDLGGGSYGYNWVPIHVAQVIDCVPPKSNYHHLAGCTPIYDTPVIGAGIQVGNIVAANHFTYPDCCVNGQCLNNVPATACQAQGGTVVPTCLGDNDGSGFDDACEPKCDVDPGSPTGCTDFCPPPGTPGQQCLPSSYGCNPNEPGTCGVLDCDCNCRIAFDAVGQPFCSGGCPDGSPCTLSGNGAIGSPYKCDCTGMCCYLNAVGVYDCVDGVTAADCQNLNGTFHAGDLCSDAIIPCCLPNGTCQDLHPLCCQDAGGTPNFNDTCSGSIEACCDAAGGCTDEDSNCCLNHGGIPQGAGTNCSMPGICGAQVCQLPTGFAPWCDALQATDCQNGAPGDSCWPVVASITATGAPDVQECDCKPYECGPMDVTVFADGTFGYRCLGECPDPTQPCVIYKNGSPTTSGAIHSSQIAPGDEIKCDCKEPPPAVCPLPTNNLICEPRQTLDCQTTGNGEFCEPEVVSIGPNGTVRADRCDCYFGNDQTCGGKIWVIELPPPSGTQISCDFNCPNPALEQCVIWMNGMPTGLISAPASSFPVGAQLWCDCDPIGTTVCDMPATTPPWCANLQNTDCRDGAAAEDCSPILASVTGTGGVNIKECDCLVDDCRKMEIIPDPAGVRFTCVNQCPIAGTQCVIWRNGVPTTMTTIHSTQAPGEDIKCDCADLPPATCEMPTQFPQWCSALQATDCLDGAAGDQCWPNVWSVTVDATGVAAPELRECDCLHECGPVTKTDHADGSFTYRCILPCPDTTQPCVIHRNGVTTTASSIHSSQIVPGERITCDCKPPPPPFCPLETNICEPLQALDCKDGVAGELCRPQKVYVDDNGQVHAKLCDCVDDNTGSICGSRIWVIELPPPNGTQISCDFNCPNDPGQQCVIFANGVSTGLISAPASQFPNQTLYCDCDPIMDPLCPLTPISAPWCQGLQAADCKDDGTGGECHPVLVSVNAAGGIDPRQCDCVGPECRRMTIIPDATGAGHTLSCDNACPDPNENCVIHLDGVPTNISSISSWQVIGHDVSCDCVEMACPLVQHWCYQRQTTECLGGNATDQCAPMVVSVTGPAPSGVDVRRCECAGDECGPVQIEKQANGVFLFYCIDLCPPGLECQIHKNGVTTGQTSILSPSVTVDEDVTCQCAPKEPTTCPLPPNMEPWCVNRPQDCQDGMAGDQCWPRVVTVSIVGGTSGTEVVECDCLPGRCGPVHITDLADGTEQYRCIYTCPESDQLCRIHRNGVNTGLFTINSSMVAPGEQITCDCVDDMQPVCPLQPGQSLCAPRQTVDCTNPVAGETCKPQQIIIGNNGQVTAEKCDCLPDGPCGPVLFFPDPPPNEFAGMISCDATCPDDPNQDCVIWRNGISTGLIQAHSSTFAPGDSLICDCDPPGTVCPLPPNQPWCDARQIFDCKDGVAGEQCRPLVVTTTTAGTPHALECDCVSGGCGPVNITQTAAGFLFRCVQACPPGEKCYIHRNGISAGVPVINANTVAPGEKITCDCVGTDPTFCPLLATEPDFCLGLQQQDCQTTAPNENCRMKEVSFDQFGNPNPLACDCYQNNGECGPILLFPSPVPPGGWQISCDQLCPDPDEQCVIYRNNWPTGLISAHSSQFAPGDKLSCGCDEVQPECKPTQDGTACTQCPTPGLECVPTVIQWNPATGWRILDCECTNECHIVPPPTPLTKPVCTGPCPNSPLTLQKKCIIKKDAPTGGYRCRCVPILPDLEPAPNPVAKNRYLSMTTGGGALRGEEEPGPTSAIRITLDSLHHPAPPAAGGPGPDYTEYEGEYRWVGPPAEYAHTNIPLTTFFAAGTLCDAHFDEFSGEFSVYGGSVVPSSQYSVQIVGDECAESLEEEECYSDPLMLLTARFGDIVGAGNSPPDGVANVLDIPAVIDQVKDEPNAVGKTQTQLHFNTPDPRENVNVIDIAYVKDAVLEFPWYETILGQPSGPCTCPSAVACDATNSCTSDMNCVGGRKCIGGTCMFVDPCNRCTPP